MGITHFNKVSGVNGVYVRSATAGEIKVADADGIYKAVSGTTTVNISGSEGVVSHFWTLASTALGTAAYYSSVCLQCSWLCELYCFKWYRPCCGSGSRVCWR